MRFINLFNVLQTGLKFKYVKQNTAHNFRGQVSSCLNSTFFAEEVARLK
jgi:hypothetical protein